MATNEQWRSTTRLRTALTWLLAATIPATVVSALALLHQSNVVNDVNRLTYTAYDESPSGVDDFLGEESLDARMKSTGKPLMVLMGAEEQIVNDPQRALDQYAGTVPGTETHLIAGAGHSPNVEKPRETAKLVLSFDESR